MALTKIGTDGIKDDAVTSDKVANAINSSIAANTAKDLTSLSASNLTSGTIPDARFPATLPAASAANLTAVPAANITGTLPAISGANLTNLPASGKATNIIVNGDLRVAQRGSASNSQNGPQTADRFGKYTNSTDETPVQEQVDVASGTTPYTLGFRKAYKITNGNQTSGGSTTTRVGIEYKVEAQDLATSGWNYTSSSSYITFSYWVRSSVAQNFYNTFGTDDGTSQRYVTETGSLSANTWTKITKTIPGNSNLTFNNDTGEGLEITWECFRGTSQTGTRPLNAWAASDNNTRTPDQTSTWYTTNDATFEITGVLLEVGETASDYPHESYAENLQRCLRYYELIVEGNTKTIGTGFAYASNEVNIGIKTHVPMRTSPSLEQNSGADYYFLGGGGDSNARIDGNWLIYAPTDNLALLYASPDTSITAGVGKYIRTDNANARLAFNAEL